MLLLYTYIDQRSVIDILGNDHVHQMSSRTEGVGWHTYRYRTNQICYTPRSACATTIQCKSPGAKIQLHARGDEDKEIQMAKDFTVLETMK